MAQTDPLLRALGEVVRERRLAAGYALDKLPGIHRNSQARLENASINTSVGQLIRVAAALDTTAGELLTEAQKRVKPKRRRR